METTKKTSVVKKVCLNVTAVMVSLNLIALVVIVAFVGLRLMSAETKYLTEVIDNISSTIETTMDAYYYSAETLSVNDGIIQLLEESSKETPMASNYNIDNVLAELTSVVNFYEGSIVNITILSVAEDSYIMSDGEISTRTTVTDRSYYEAVTKRTTIITTPYVQSQNNTRVVSTSSPVFGSNGNVIGCVVVNVPTSFVSNLISDFGLTGGTWVMDSDSNVLAHSNSSYIGENYSAVGVSGSNFTKEMANPTGELITYDRNGTSRTGSLGAIPGLGWVLVAGIDASEFFEDTIYVGCMLIVILVTCVVLSLLACGKNIFKSLKPLEELNVSMNEMANGNLSAQPQHRSNDEIGDLCHNLRRTMRTLNTYIDEIKSNLNAFGKGDFTRTSDIEFLGDFHEIQNSTNSFVVLITQTLEEIKSSVDQVSSGTDYVASGSQNLAHGSIQQAESVNILNTTVEDISNSVSENVKNIESVNAQSQQASSELATSNQKMNEMVKAMGDIEKSSDAIQNIIKVIEDVAFQTDILALNAAVEASRAGPAGRGFAIVADEVRNLAARTSEAVEETVRLIEESKSAVSVGSILVEQTSSSLNKANEVVSGYIETLDTVTIASKGQAESIKEINSSINEITAVTQNNTSISEESAAASEELSSQATIMKESIDKFKLSN